MGCKKTGVYKNCDNGCGRNKYVRKCELKSYKNFFCSKKCRSRFIGEKLSIKYRFTCNLCGVEFFVLGSRKTKKGRQFCSTYCANTFRIGKSHTGGAGISIALKGKPKSFEHIEKVANANRGKKRPQMSGVNHPRWNGLTPLKEQIRKSFENKQWKYFCFKRDKNKCTQCGSSKNIEVDHIVPFSFIIKTKNIKTLEEAIMCSELWDTNNGRTLCRPCHKKTDTYGEKAKKWSTCDAWYELR